MNKTMLIVFASILSFGDHLIADEANIFLSRILPIAKSQNSSSCSECHFGGVELGNFIGESEQKTFASLRDQGLINIEDPASSKLLTFIKRHGDQTSKIQSETRDLELAAFQSWIENAVKNPNMLASKSDVKVGIELPVEVVRHLRKDRVLESFHDHVWIEMGRCVNCHSPGKNERQVKKHGEQMSWIVPGDPAATLEKCVDQQIIDVDDPEQSEILTKPNGEAKHGGGPKFSVGSEADKSFRLFLTDYSKTVKQAYARVEQIPAPENTVRHPTFQFMRMTGFTDDYAGKLLQVRLHRWTGSEWTDQPVAIADNRVNKKNLIWMSSVFELIEKGSKRHEQVKTLEFSQIYPGKFRADIYFDQHGRLADDPSYAFTKKDFVKSVKFGGEWKTGYKQPLVLSFNDAIRRE